MKIVFLDAKTIGDDINLSGFDAIGDVTRKRCRCHYR